MTGMRNTDPNSARRFFAGVFACLFVLHQLFALPGVCAEPAHSEAHVSAVASADAALCDARSPTGSSRRHSDRALHCCFFCDGTAHLRALAPQLAHGVLGALRELNDAPPSRFRADGAAPQSAGRDGAWSSRAPPARA
jgi:hypothetical protein